jgi:hypothetical protein
MVVPGQLCASRADQLKSVCCRVIVDRWVVDLKFHVKRGDVGSVVASLPLSPGSLVAGKKNGVGGRRAAEKFNAVEASVVKIGALVGLDLRICQIVYSLIIGASQKCCKH